jgi:hypothetical protein
MLKFLLFDPKLWPARVKTASHSDSYTRIHIRAFKYAYRYRWTRNLINFLKYFSHLYSADQTWQILTYNCVWIIASNFSAFRNFIPSDQLLINRAITGSDSPLPLFQHVRAFFIQFIPPHKTIQLASGLRPNLPPTKQPTTTTPTLHFSTWLTGDISKQPTAQKPRLLRTHW